MLAVPVDSSCNTNLRERAVTMSLLKELISFLLARKKLWLLPIILVMIIMGGLLVLAQGSVFAPFVYTLF